MMHLTARLGAVVAAVGALAAAVTGCGSSSPAAPARPNGAPGWAAGHSRPPRTVPSGDWAQFGDSAERSGVGPSATGITVRDVGSLERRVVRLPGTVDSAAVELHAVRVRGRVRDVAVVTTTYGITVALDPGTGRILWQFRPRGLRSVEGTGQVTTATPIVDPDRRYVYSTSPDGYVHKLRIADGRAVWSTRVTFDPTHEKLASSLNISGRSLIAVTDGYYGDAPPYQGHVVTIDLASGRITHVFNSLCSGVRRLLDPPSRCPYSDSGIWGRAGAIVEPGSGRILVTTSNGDPASSATFNGRTNWSDSVLELSPSLQLLHNYTPPNQLQLTRSDTDLGSTSPALLPATGGRRLAVQGGKDGVLRLLDLTRLNGTTGPAGPRTGGELQDIDDPGSTDLFTAPAVWAHAGHVYVFVADNSGTAAYELGAGRRLFRAWQDGTPGTSPVLAGGLLYVYDEESGDLLIRRPTDGHVIASLAAAPGHWNSPIVVGGRIILPTGDYHSHSTSGTLYIFHVPGR